MSSLLSLSIALSKKEKHYANSRARRNGEVIITHSKKLKKDKETDTESLTSSAASSLDTSISAEREKCPLRFILAGMFETEADTEPRKPRGCPLRRDQLWHVIPLCLLAIINIFLVIVALLGLAGYRIAMVLQDILVSLVKNDLDNPYVESLADIDDVTLNSDKR